MSKQNDFINEIGPIIAKYAKKYGYKVASTTIAQACVESAYGNAWSRKYNNYFGIKYGSWVKRTSIASEISVVSAKTQEEYRAGYLTTIVDGFCKCPTMEIGVQLYYEFLRVNSRYKDLKNAATAEDMAKDLKSAGYATSSRYVQTLMSCVNQNNLTKFDTEMKKNNTEKKKEAVSSAKQTYQIGKYSLYDVKYAPNEHSEVVHFLQQLLNTKTHAGLVEDGYAGEKTLLAIAKYQSEKLHSIVCDKKTWEILLG